MSLLKRYPNNPVLHEDNIPWDCMSVFNAGICKQGDRYLMLFRTDSGPRERPVDQRTKIGVAQSDDGFNWKVAPDPIFDSESMHELLVGQYTNHFPREEIVRIYDPRITIIDGEIYLCAALDTKHGIRGLIAKTSDLGRWDLLHITLPENRNMVLFPERVNGNFLRLDRPFPLYYTGGKESFDIWYSSSPDGRHWGEHRLLLAAEQVPFSNCKIGPGAPPIRTEKGWLAAFHAVIKNENKPLCGWSPEPWTKEYVAGLMLLDLEKPYKVIGMSQTPLLTSEESYETEGFRGSVIFPGGMIAEEEGSVKMYYGAADTVVALATGTVDELLSAITPF
ncbi:glycoside hydrolase family 130 protein [Ruficoccus sp. ZRK36]|uniref:glycoside hydrolase family 130 protein n=1 Tax=Ruficoccus sp. ZRK36 TaxID=2866311 RepID=UPI001C734A4C|nr:glycoside hydrolase family 130 protein [Ruficoccus sp. ZRK36]QYY37268.1 glycoside hydrolase family 130 protein [Ruficoccus sp. ZRK36]